MKTTNFVGSNTPAGVWVLYCLAFAFCFAFAGCSVLQTFSGLEKEALKYGTVSVGAVRVTDYNDPHLKDARQQLRTALNNLRKELGGDPSKSRPLSAAGGDSNPSSNTGEESSGVLKGQTTRLSEVEMVGLRMAALKFVESEIEDVNLVEIDPVEPNFHRVVISLDCSAWVQGKAGAALVYIDLYPYKVDCWCHEAAQIMKEWWNELKDSKRRKKPKGRKDYEDCWNEVVKEKLKYAFKCLDQSKMEMPPKSAEIKEEDPSDWVAFCHRWLEDKKLFPCIVHVERMGKAEYLILAESGYATTELEIGGVPPVGPSAKVGLKAHEEAKRLMAMVRPLSLAFVAGDRRAGWLFMPSKTREARMPPTERRLRMVVDIPKDLVKLSIHVHKVFLGPDLGILPGAILARQVDNLGRTRELLTEADQLYEKYKATEPGYYRLIKTRMRNLLYQGWAEEIPVEIPAKRMKEQ